MAGIMLILNENENLRPDSLSRALSTRRDPQPHHDRHAIPTLRPIRLAPLPRDRRARTRTGRNRHRPQLYHLGVHLGRVWFVVDRVRDQGAGVVYEHRVSRDCFGQWNARRGGGLCERVLQPRVSRGGPALSRIIGTSY